MPQLTESEKRVLFRFALHSLKPSVLQALLRGGAARDQALDRATEVIIEHMARGRHEVHRPDRDGGPLFG